MNYSYFGGAFKYLNPGFPSVSSNLIDYLESAFKNIASTATFQSWLCFLEAMLKSQLENQHFKAMSSMFLCQYKIVCFNDLQNILSKLIYCVHLKALCSNLFIIHAYILHTTSHNRKNNGL